MAGQAELVLIPPLLVRPFFGFSSASAAMFASLSFHAAVTT